MSTWCESASTKAYSSSWSSTSATGYEGSFYRRKIVYYYENGLTYWTMGEPVEETIIINRCKKEDTYEYRLLHGTLPD